MIACRVMMLTTVIEGVAIMVRRPSLRKGLHWLAASAAIAFTTAVFTVLHVGPIAAGLVFLTVVVWFATRAGTVLSLYVAGIYALSFDFFFLPPIHTFRLAGPQEWFEMLCFFVTSVIVSRLAERARAQARSAEQRREDVERLYTLSQELMLHEDAGRLIQDLPRMIAKSFQLDAVVLYVRDRDQFYASGIELRPSIQASMREQAEGNSTALPRAGEFFFLPLMLGLQPLGSLAWTPDRLSREVATAIAAQTAIALTRSIAIETYTRLEATREGERLRVALIDSLTHELRTPLTSIRAAATTLMSSDALDNEIRADLTALVDEESARLDKLIGEAVQMAELDAHVVRVQAEPHRARALFDEVVEDSSQILSSHRIVIDVEEPDFPAWFDPRLLERVLRHLLENAVRYSPAGSRITLASRRREGRLEFSVSDTGPGINPADLPFIFEKFYRGKTAVSGTGTGMGLAIVRAILEAHGGEITVRSQPGQGSTFTFWVPLKVSDPAIQ